MAFSLKASPSSSAALGHVRRCGAAAAVVTVPRRFVVRALAAATAVNPPAAGSRLALTAPRVMAASVHVANKRALSVAQTLSRIKEQGKTALIPYITAGDPDLATTAEALRLLAACGADVIELGMPFSDPYADGPIIQASAARALAGGTTIDAVLSMPVSSTTADQTSEAEECADQLKNGRDEGNGSNYSRGPRRAVRPNSKYCGPDWTR